VKKVQCRLAPQAGTGSAIDRKRRKAARAKFAGNLVALATPPISPHSPRPCVRNPSGNFELVLRERQQAAKVTVPHKLVWHSTPKVARIQAIEPYYSNGQLLFLDTWNRDYPELVEQLIPYPLAAHDDGPDALAGAIALILANEKAQRQVLIPRAR